MTMAKAKFEPVFINNILTPTGRVSFPHLVEPDSKGQYADNKYKLSLLILKKPDNAADIAALAACKKAVIDCAVQTWPGRKWKGGVDKPSFAELMHPFKNGDDKPDLAGHAGCFVFTCKTKNPPTIVGRKVTQGGKATFPNIPPAEVYGGCYARLIVTAMSYEQKGNPGVTFLLETVQKRDEGERFGGGGGSTAILDDETEDEVVVDDDLGGGPSLGDDDDDMDAHKTSDDDLDL
jgi:hypothetical protein